MPEFMVLIHESEAVGATLAPRETSALLERQAAYEQELRTLAAYVDGERLRPPAEGRRQRKRSKRSPLEPSPRPMRLRRPIHRWVEPSCQRAS